MLHKIEQGVMDGLVLHNKLVDKSMEAVAETGRRREKNAQLKAMRRKEQVRGLSGLGPIDQAHGNRRCVLRRSAKKEKKESKRPRI